MIKVEPFNNGNNVVVSMKIMLDGMKYEDTLMTREMSISPSTLKPRLRDLNFHPARTSDKKSAISIIQCMADEREEFFATVDREWAKFQELHKVENHAD